MRFSQIPFFKEFQKLSIHRKIYIIGLLIMAIGLPLSTVLVSNAQFILALNWLAERNFKTKFAKIKNNKTIWAFLLLPLLHVLWLINTSDFSYAIHDLKIKIPLLIIPLIIGTVKPLSLKELRWILYAFVFAVFCGTTVSFAVITNIYKIEYYDIRNISVFISHIRFGLMLVLSMLITGYYFIADFNVLHIWKKTAISLLLVWFLLFLIILQSITGWVALLMLLFLIFAKNYKKIELRFLKIVIWTVLVFIIAGSIGLVSKVYYDFYLTKTYDFASLPENTPRGNKYYNDTTSQLKENGHYVRILISYKELAKTWPKLSKIPFQGYDAIGYPVRNTMIRYLASKGLPKDTDGLLALEPEDVKLIEDGYANCVYRKKFIPYVKTYNVIWEIDRYVKTGNANNKSIVQRIEFGRTAIHIIHNNFWFGVGTGDLKNAYTKAYNEMNSNLKKRNRLRAHNQFMTFFVTFGVFGFLLAIFSMIYPGIKNQYTGGLFLMGFMLMIFISMLNEDTLETQAGVTFYIVFYTLFVFQKKNHD